MNPSRLSARGAEFIAAFEGFSPRPYDDPAGLCTVGYGHLIHHSACTAADMREWGTITEARGLELLREDAAKAETCVLANVHPPIQRQERFDALVSFVYNLGCGPLQPGTGLHAALNRADRKDVTERLMLYVNAGGHRLPGLVRRRQAECRLWNLGLYS